MSAATPALFAAAAGVGFGHAILPDHWVPLAVLGRARRYPMSKIDDRRPDAGRCRRRRSDQGDWLDRWGNAVTAGVLVIIGVLVLTGVI